MSAWFEPRNEQIQDPKKQHKSLVNDQLQLQQLRAFQAAQTILPPVAPPSTMTVPPCPICLGARCGQGPLCQSIGQGVSNPIETSAPDAIQESNRIPRDHIFRFELPRPLVDTKMMVGVLLVGFVTGAAVWVRRQPDNAFVGSLSGR